MNANFLDLPAREAKPRKNGITSILDTGTPTQQFKDFIESHGNYIDMVKLGWGTCMVTKDLTQKIDILQQHGIDYYFGGTLFEKAWLQNKVEALFDFFSANQVKWVEISDGTVALPHAEKLKYIELAAKKFSVMSEVGYKDQTRSADFYPAEWIKCIQSELAAGAQKCITEARESGQSGICRSNGEIRFGLIHEILNGGVSAKDLIFEAPNKSLQTYFIKLVGSDVNLGNIAFSDVIPLETLRLGLRSDTLESFK
ncbi:phosphosulfolactate synthase [Rheinheimera maricola]|uniref:Phosphosulfolactate synthase n=1 Tax=Rheinheimera maricola TaxID=2793282 RepID=A0ABS7X505_9GAMM|nr:phosphosulfolactate synthase [Rheinheimera maricola]MBZ9610215.1 phosphosulfolactate synthase [Rheinheimera maricola]